MSELDPTDPEDLTLTEAQADRLDDGREYYRRRFHARLRHDAGITDDALIRELIVDLLSLDELPTRSILTAEQYKELAMAVEAWYIVEGLRS